MTNHFALYDKTDRDEATKKIDKAIKLFCKRITQIRTEHPEVGMGDTETDECITDVLYSEMHY